MLIWKEETTRDGDEPDVAFSDMRPMEAKKASTSATVGVSIGGEESNKDGEGKVMSSGVGSMAKV